MKIGTTRGQVTLFIIVGIVVLSILAMLLFARKEIVGPVEINPLSIDTTPIEWYVEQCLQSTAEEGIFHNGLQGGYFFLPEQATTALSKNVPYYYSFGQDFSPSDILLAEQLGAYIDTMMDFCLDQFKPFTEKGYSITFSPPTSSVTLRNHKITVRTTLPISISQGIQIREISNFMTEISAEQFSRAIIVAREIVTSQHDGEICLTCFSDLAEQYNLFVGIIPFGEEAYLFDITDNDYILNNENYHLRFAVRFHEE